MSNRSILPLFNRVNRSPLSGIIKQQAEDFEVQEKLVYEPIGEGEHAFLFVRKIGQTTTDLARKIARLANVNIRQVSYAGLKDKQAMTQQWFSVHLPGKESPDWNLLNNESVVVEHSTRHDRKLRQGQIRSNSFKIIVKQFSVTDKMLEDFQERVQSNGVPNYFTEQRFGIDANNLKSALRLLQTESTVAEAKSRSRRRYDSKRGMYLSAARSLLFNQVLSSRVEKDNWNKAIEGDLFIKTGRHGMFSVTEIDQEILERIALLKISPTGPLYGINSMDLSDEALQIENDAMTEYVDYQTLLQQQKVKADRRALRLVIENLRVKALDSTSMQINFDLPSGCYATAVLRELVQYPGQMS